MKVRLRRFEIERDEQKNDLIKIYIKLFLYSPIGTVVQIYYQHSYKWGIKRIRKS